MAQLNFTLDSEIIKKFLSETEKNEGIRLLIETFLNQILKSQSDEQNGLVNSIVDSASKLKAINDKKSKDKK